jgi:hypothetical protein
MAGTKKIRLSKVRVLGAALQHLSLLGRENRPGDRAM